MTAEDVSMPAAPNAAIGSVAASAMRTSTERRGPRSSAQSMKSSPSAQGSAVHRSAAAAVHVVHIATLRSPIQGGRLPRDSAENSTYQLQFY